jgi:hypothetical protein
LKRRDGLDRRSIEQYVCVISDFRMVAVNETFFVADVRRFSLETFSTTLSKTLENVPKPLASTDERAEKR